MKGTSALLIASLSLLPQVAGAQGTDCNALARDLVVKKFQSNWSDISKLFFLSSLTQMDLKTSKEAFEHVGKVNVGPISIGPGSWNLDRQNRLRKELEQFVNIEQLRQSAASVSVSSGDPGVGKVVSDCFKNNGGLLVTLSDAGKETAVVNIMWTSYPGAQITATIDSVTVVHGKIIGGESWAKKGAKLNERLPQAITIERGDPKKDLVVVVNTQNAGSNLGYLPPSELPPRPPPKIVKIQISGEEVTAWSGGDRNPGCQDRTVQSCVTPQHGGKIVPGTGAPKILSQNGQSGFCQPGVTNSQCPAGNHPRETPQEYCVSFWASTTACQTRVEIKGVASATEEYTEDE